MSFHDQEAPLGVCLCGISEIAILHLYIQVLLVSEDEEPRPVKEFYHNQQVELFALC